MIRSGHSAHKVIFTRVFTAASDHASLELAFRNGDPFAVRLMFGMLCSMTAHDPGIPRSMVKSQLEREFGLTLPEPLFE